jgi:hypothetical protein
MDQPLGGYCNNTFFYSSNRQYTDGDTGYLIYPEGIYGYWWCDQLILCAVRKSPDFTSAVQCYVGKLTDSTTWKPVGTLSPNLIAGGDLTYEQQIYDSNEQGFYLPINADEGLIWGVSNSGVSGVSWGSVSCSGRIFTAIN